MSRVLGGVVLVAFLGVPPLAEEEKARDNPPAVGEKAPAKDLLSLTGVVEKVDAKDEKNGTFVLRTGGGAVRHTFQVNPKTKILRNTADPLELGLKSPLLKGAKARVTFSQPAPGEREERSSVRVCRILQLTKTAK